MREVDRRPGLPLPLALLTGGLAFLGVVTLFSVYQSAIAEPLKPLGEPQPFPRLLPERDNVQSER